ncbi:hypothetical protein OK074_0375 [Actinobacteria bacterium OK074]|nr:hypothetical protein OK074_0375 [Actinobacteria bacterium OK074]
MGLRSFREQDAAWFFGREQLVAGPAGRLWETSPQRVAGRVCRIGHPRMTGSEWKKYFGNVDYRPPCP